MKIAVTNCVAQGPFESLAAMLREAGYETLLPSTTLVTQLQALGCRGVETTGVSAAREGTDPMEDVSRAWPNDVERCDLFVDVKVQNHAAVTARWPRLKGKYLWYRINGGQPTETWETDPPCPVLTPNLWYKTTKINHDLKMPKDCDCGGDTGSCPICDGGLDFCIRCKGGESDLDGPCKAYTMWPPFVGAAKLDQPRRTSGWDTPMCLVHNLKNWIGPELVDAVRPLGVRMHGWRSPDGLLPNAELPRVLSSALALVHLKNTDAPGYSIYEAMTASCPIICSKQFVEGNRMQELLEPGVTCLTYDFGVASQAEKAALVIKVYLQYLRDPEFNRNLGNNGQERLKSLLWTAERNGPGFKEWMGRNFKWTT